MDEQLIEKLKQKHGRIFSVAGVEAEVVFRAPKKAEWDAFNSQLISAEDGHRALELLARQIVVHPEPDLFGQLLEEFPGLPITIGDQVKPIIGLVAGAKAKKL